MNRGGGGGLGVGQRGAGNYQKSTSKRVQGQPTLRGATKGGKKY